MKMKWILALVFLIFVVRPVGLFYYEVHTLSAEINTELRKHLIDSEDFILRQSAQASSFPAVFEKLNCVSGPDFATKTGKNKDAYLINDPALLSTAKAQVTVEIPNRLEKDGWRKKFAVRMVPKRVMVCNTCEVKREYSFKIDQWKVEKPIEPSFMYLRRDKGIYWAHLHRPSTEWNAASIKMLVTWGPNNYTKVGGYVNRKEIGPGMWISTGDAKLAAMETSTPYCIFTWPELKLVARKTIVTKPPQNSRDFPIRKEDRERLEGLAEKEIAAKPQYEEKAENFVREHRKSQMQSD